MPTAHLNLNLDVKLAVNQLEDICFDYGLELETKCKEDSDIIPDSELRVDVPANRPDLLCTESIAMVLRSFSGIQNRIRIRTSSPRKELIVRKDVDRIRPFCFAAVLRNVNLTEESLKSLMNFQDKLHLSIGKKRSLVAIGTHDMDTIESPFEYVALDPKSFKFAPLNSEIEMDGHEILEHLSNSPQIKAYVPLIKDFDKFPIIRDKNGTILSLPPIINGNHSRITVNTKNILIEVTAWDKTKGNIVIKTIASIFSIYCKDAFSVEPVIIKYEEGHNIFEDSVCFTNPNLKYKSMIINRKTVSSRIGVEFSNYEISKLLMLMGYTSQLDSTPNNLIFVDIPPWRSDILHECDIIEDIAIAYGYNKLRPTSFYQKSFEQKSSVVTDFIRSTCVRCGFAEVLLWGLVIRIALSFHTSIRQCSEDEIYEKLGRPRNACINFDSMYSLDKEPVTIANPKTRNFQVVRTTLVHGLLKYVAQNKSLGLPIKRFEIGDVVICDKTTETKSKTIRNVAAIIGNTQSNLEIIHGLLNEIMSELKVNLRSKANIEEGAYYFLEPPQRDNTRYSSTYLEGQFAHVFYKNSKYAEPKIIGRIAVMHPQVLKSFDLHVPCSVFEITLPQEVLNSDL